MEIISSSKIAAANGHYSQAISHNGTLYISGQLPVDPITKQIPESIEAQTLMTLNKVDLILNESNSSRQKIIQMRIYISDISLWDRVNTVYASFMGDHKPVRCVVPTKKLHFGCLIEIEAIAALST